MSTNTFLKLGDIEGESTISGFEKQMELINFTNGFHQPTSPIRSSTGPTTGQAVHSMMNVTKYLDSSSPNICKALWSAKVLAAVWTMTPRSSSLKSRWRTWWWPLTTCVAAGICRMRRSR